MRWIAPIWFLFGVLVGVLGFAAYTTLTAKPDLDEAAVREAARNGTFDAIATLQAGGPPQSSGNAPDAPAAISASFTLREANRIGDPDALVTIFEFGDFQFLVLGLMVERATRVVQRMRRHLRAIEIASGVLLIVMGILLLTDQLFQIAIWAQRNRLYLDVGLGGSDTPTYLIAAVAGLLSFFSPCVLPLVPAYLGYLGGPLGSLDGRGS